MKLKNDKLNNWINVLDMEDGQVAVIRSWSYATPIGSLVQRYGQSLIRLGFHSDNSWPDIFETDRNGEGLSECLVEILPPGTELVL